MHLTPASCGTRWELSLYLSSTLKKITSSSWLLVKLDYVGWREKALHSKYPAYWTDNSTAIAPVNQVTRRFRTKRYVVYGVQTSHLGKWTTDSPNSGIAVTGFGIITIFTIPGSFKQCAIASSRHAVGYLLPATIPWPSLVYNGKLTGMGELPDDLSRMKVWLVKTIVCVNIWTRSHLDEPLIEFNMSPVIRPFSRAPPDSR